MTFKDTPSLNLKSCDDFVPWTLSVSVSLAVFLRSSTSAPESRSLCTVLGRSFPLQVLRSRISRLYMWLSLGCAPRNRDQDRFNGNAFPAWASKIKSPFTETLQFVEMLNTCNMTVQQIVLSNLLKILIYCNILHIHVNKG